MSLTPTKLEKKFCQQYDIDIILGVSQRISMKFTVQYTRYSTYTFCNISYGRPIE